MESGYLNGRRLLVTNKKICMQTMRLAGSNFFLRLLSEKSLIFLLLYHRTWRSKWSDANPADRSRIVVDNLAALLSASVLKKKFSQLREQMGASTQLKLDALLTLHIDIAEAVVSAYMSTETLEVTDEVAAIIPAHLQMSLPEHQRKKVLNQYGPLLLILWWFDYGVINFCSL